MPRAYKLKEDDLLGNRDFDGSYFDFSNASNDNFHGRYQRCDLGA